MATEITATFSIDNWDEREIDQHDNAAKLTQATVAKTYEGDIRGSSTTEWLMAYAADGSASFVGLERIRGTLAGRDGTVVVRHVGTFQDGAARAELTVVPGSGTGALETAAGSGSFLADPKGSVQLDVRFA